MLGTPFEEWRKRVPARERARSGVEETLQFLIDKQRIADMITEYGLACDSRSWDVLEELYDEAITREMTGTLSETVSGRANLIALHRNPVLPRAEGVNTVKVDLGRFRNREIRHLISTRLVRVADDNRNAWALCYYQMALVGEDDEGWHHGLHEGTYVFTFRKVSDNEDSGAWRFTQHLIWTNNAVNPMFGQKAK